VILNARSSAEARIAALLGAVAVATALSGCTAMPVQGDGPPGPETLNPQASVEVAIGSITPVITLEGEVAGPVDFQITADVDGSILVDDIGNMLLRDASGKSLKISDDKDVSYEPLLETGSNAVAGLPIAQAKFDSFALVATIEGADLLRMVEKPSGVRAQISGLGAPFPCELLDERPSSPAALEVGQPRFVGCKIPRDQKVISGLRGLIAIQFASRTDVLVLPVEAVAGTLESGSVFIEEGGSRVEKQVRLGASDGHNIEIISGLTEGQEVSFPSPSLYN